VWGVLVKVSVIIPVYNIESYIADCISSVLSQDYKSLEIILVDDGSSDNSGTICDEYALKDPRVKVIHKTNSGLSEARNAGIAASTGEYTLFLDGDDLWADPYAVSNLVSRINQTQADVLNFSYTKWFENSGISTPYFSNVSDMPPTASLSAQLEYLSENGLYIASACNKMIRSSLLENLPFASGVSSEDILWCAKLMLCANSMDFVCSDFYVYRQRSNSIRYTIDDKKCRDLASNILSCVALAKTAPSNRKLPLLRYSAFQLGTFF